MSSGTSTRSTTSPALLERGSRLLLPTWEEGARFSCGDPHASQGDGEVCVSALECPMRAVLRLTFHDRPTGAPSYAIGPSPAQDILEIGGAHGTMGLAEDLYTASQRAVRAMIDWLEAEHGLTREDAYVLCSLVADLRIHELVDAGVFNVGCVLLLAVLVAV